MSTTKRFQRDEPTFSLVKDPKTEKSLLQEIRKMRPQAEITVEGSTEIGSGKILSWEASRKFFTVQWIKSSAAFEEQLESNSDFRVYFKVKLFSKMVLFKSQAVRRLRDGTAHFRVPEQFFQQQRRSALRVPMTDRVFLGKHTVLDLSTGGASFQIKSETKAEPAAVGMQIDDLQIISAHAPLLRSQSFSIRITHTEPAPDGSLIAGCRFVNMKSRTRALLKQFLIQALHRYYQEKIRTP